MNRRYNRHDQSDHDTFKRRDTRFSNGVSLFVGSSLVVATLGLCIIGTNHALSSMQRQMDEVLAQAKQSVSDDYVSSQLGDASDGSSTIVGNDGKWTSEQIEWMRENRITYRDGKPYDALGHVVDDPTTDVNEADSGSFKDTVPSDIDNSDPNGSNNADDKSEDKNKSNKKPKKEPEISPAWYEGNDAVKLTDKGKPYYVVKHGDCLNKIANMFGFTDDELAAHNGIDNKHLIHTGDKIYFPERKSDQGVDLQKGLG